MEHGKELEVKKEKLDQKVLSMSNNNQTPSSSKMPDMDTQQHSKALSE